MPKNNFKLIYIACTLFTLLSYISASAQKAAKETKPFNKDQADDSGEITTIVTAHSSDAIFSNAAAYTFEVKNTMTTDQAGKLSYVVSDQNNKKLRSDVIHIKIAKLSSGSYDFNIPALKTGFYKISFMINVTDYDDTTRREFGIRPDKIKSTHEKPGDFDAFWQKAKRELATVKPEFKMTEKPELAKDNRKVFLIEMKSLDNFTIRGWMTIPSNQPKNKKFSVLLGLPGYQVSLPPILGQDNDLAIITLDVRGQGLSRDVINIRKEDFIILNIDDKNKYVMRGVIMDCIRCIDFIFSRPELNHDNIFVSGGSMGGFLTIAVAGLDKRVTICSAQNPIMSDVYNLDGEVDWPISNMKKYVKIKPGLSFQTVLSNLQYYDTKNFATTINCPTLMGIGLLDPYVPPNNAYAVYNNIPSKKKILVYKNLAHEVSQSYKDYEGRWMRDTFGLF